MKLKSARNSIKKNASYISLVVMAAFFIFGAQTQSAADNTNVDDRVNDIAHLLMCPVCQGQSVAESNSNLAYDMRQIIRKQLEEGKSEKEIINYFTARYGESILAAPPAKGINWLLWLLPAALTLLAICSAFIYLYRIRGGGAPALRTGEENAVRNSEYLRRIDEEINKRGF